MKICMVVPWFPSLNADTVESQQGIFDYRQTMQLVERGHEFRIISIQWRGQTTAETISNEVEIRRIAPIFIFPRIRYPIPNFVALNREIKSNCITWKPDVLVFSHAIYLTALPVLWLKKLNIPVIVSTDVYPGLSWSYGSKLVDSVGYLYSILVMRRIFKHADGIHLMNSQLNEYDDKIHLDTGKAFTITRGVDTELFQPRNGVVGLRENFGINQDDTVILYAGRLDLVKGVDYLLQAAEKVLSRHSNIKFLIVGDGSLRQQYEESTKALSPAVIFTGWQSDVPRLMNSADIFVLPSLSEGAANVVMEASASGLPVIATSVGEVPRIVSDGETGILVKPKDVNALVEAIETLIGDPARAKKMGQAGRKRVEEIYNWGAVCERVEEVYQGVVNRVNRMSSHYTPSV